jgi:hypothetical protein
VGSELEGTTKRDLVVQAIRELGSPCSIRDIKEWMAERFDYSSYDDVPNCLSALTINDRSRRHNDKGRKDFTPVSGHPRDVLIKAQVRGTSHVRYWFYDHMTAAPTPHVAREDLDWSYNRR